MASSTLAGFRLAPQQERLCQLQQGKAGAPAYVAQCAVALQGQLDREGLHQGLSRLVSRHEILRTAFVQPAGLNALFQVIAENCAPAWENLDYGDLEGPQKQARLADYLRSERNRPFELDKAPLLRVGLVKFSPVHHVLTLTLPALAADARSLNNLIGELREILSDSIQNQPSEDEPLRYVQFSEWQNELAESNDEQAVEGRKYWSAVDLSVPVIPLSRKAEGALFLPQSVDVPLAPTIGPAIEAMCARYQIAPSVLFLAAWSALIWRITGHEATIGVLMEGREYEELTNAIGLFARNLPIACRYSGDFRFEELLQQVKAQLHDVAEWQDYYPSSVAADLPLAFEYDEWESGQVNGLRIEVVERYTCLDRFQLKLSAGRLGGRLRAELHYDGSALQREAVERWAAHVATLLEGAIQAPEAKIADLPLLTPRERQQLLTDWNQTAADYPQDLCIHQWFEQQVERTAQAPALRFGDQVLTYAELNARANQVAHALRQAGVTPSTLVGLCLERSLELMVGLLGILKAGGAYVPLNPDTPPARLAQQLSAARALVTQENLRTKMSAFAGSVLCLDSDRATLTQQSTANPPCNTTSDNLVYVLYTSGSTGVPKGVAVRHRNLVNYTQFICRRLELKAGLQFATVSTIAADLGNTCIYPALVSGGCLHLISYEAATDSAQFSAYLNRYPIDVLKIVPSHLGALLRASDGRPLLPRRHLILGGETLKPELLEQIRATGATCRVLNHYGPTETTVGSLTFETEEYESLRRWSPASVPIGRPIANTQVYILDEQRQPVPVGTIGELYIAGAGVAEGYWQQPELTQERFLPDPFRGEGRMYRTGDRARWMPSGVVEFLGRADDQVKIRGFRIELGEIETVLAEHAGVRQAVVLASEAENGEKRLVGYIVPKTHPAPSSEQLQQHLAHKLPDYMVPGLFVTLDKLPLTANGKLDRKALLAMEAQGPEREYVAPRTPVEEVLAGMWQELLKLERIGIHDDLFKLGAHSLLATQLISRVRRTFQVEVPLRAMFEAPTVAGLAQRIEAAQRQTATQAPALVPVPRTDPMPLSFAQQRLWFFSQLESDGSFYNVPRAVRLRGNLHVEALEWSLNQIAARHEVLRTTFSTVDDQPVQVISPSVQLRLAVTDLRSMPEAERESEAQRLAGEEARTSFDLSQGPLLRPRLLRLADDHHVLLLTMHHIVSDAWSANILFQELEALYSANLEGKPAALPELPVQYADYAFWERNLLTGDGLAAQLAYWRAQLEGAPTLLPLRTDRPRPPAQSFRGAKHTFAIPKEITAQLRQLSQQQGTTLFMTLLAGFQILLAHHSGQRDIVVGTDLANRTRVETERLIGFFINLLPLRTTLPDSDMKLSDLLDQVRETALGAYAHQELPFDKLIEELRLERSASYNPLVQVLFVMQNTPRSPLKLPGIEVGSFGMKIERSKFDFALFMVEAGDGLIGHWVYSTDLFDEATIKRLADLYQVVLAAMPGKHESELGHFFDLLAEAEKQRVASAGQEFEEASKRRLQQIKRRTAN